MAQTSATRLIEEKEYQHKIAKLWVWIVWLGTMLVSAAYCVISILSFEHVLSIYNRDNDEVDDHELWAFLGATMIAPVMVIGFYFFGTMVLVKKTVTEGGLSYSYGALHISTLWMSMLVLMSAVSIHAYKDRMKRWEKTGLDDPELVVDWDGGKTTQAQVSYVLGYVLSLVFLVLFFFLFIFRSAAQRLYIDPKLRKREEEEKRDMEEQALLRAQLEQQKATAVAAAPAEGKKPEAAGSEIKPDAAVKISDKKVEPKKEEPKKEEPKKEEPVKEEPTKEEPKEEEPKKEKKAGGWWSRKPKEAEAKDSAAVRTPVGPDQVSVDAQQPKI